MDGIDMKKGKQAIRAIESIFLLTAIMMGSFYSYEEKNIYIFLVATGSTIFIIALIELIIFIFKNSKNHGK